MDKITIMEREYQSLLAEGRRARAWRKKWELSPNELSNNKRKNKSKSKEGKV